MSAVTKISPNVAKVFRTGAVDVDDQLAELARLFTEDARAIDPTISGMWLGSDMTFKGRAAAVFSVTFERKGSEFLKPARAKPEGLS